MENVSGERKTCTCENCLQSYRKNPTNSNAIKLKKAQYQLIDRIHTKKNKQNTYKIR